MGVKMPKIKYNCLNCGKEVERYDSQAKKYCSPECYREDKAKTLFVKVCPICDREYEGKVSQIYCSKRCKRKRDRQAEIEKFVLICPRCKKKRTVSRPSYQKNNTLCKKCAGLIAREKSPSPSGKNSHVWKGGRRIDSQGYVKLHKPGHQFADSTNYVREHIYVICEEYGVEFFETNGGCVHHINGDKQDNSLNNLYVCTSEQNKQYTSDLLEIAYALVKKGIIKFADGKYSCPLLGDEIGEARQSR